MEGGGYLWLIIDVALVAALGGAIVYGLLAWRRARGDRALKAHRDEATRDLYRKSDENA